MTAVPSAPENPHPTAEAARALFEELLAAGHPVVGVGIGEGRIFVRVSSPEHQAPASFRGYPVITLTDEGIKR
jgi:hypothetical protein